MADSNNNNPDSFFQRLTKIFRSNPSIQRRVKGHDYRSYYGPKFSQNNMGYRGPSAQSFGRENSPFSSMGEAGILDRLSRYSEFQNMEYCLHGDTKIAIPNGYMTLKELSEKYNETEKFIVYSWDDNNKRVVPAWAKMPRKTKSDHTWKVTFDSGKTIIGTADHRLMRRDGSYVRIDALQVGDAMMPFKRYDLMAGKSNGDTGKGYRWIYNGFKYVREHTVIAEWAYRPVETNEVVHHKNFIKFDNRPENLAIMDKEEHTRYHVNLCLHNKAFREGNLKTMLENNPAERHDINIDEITEWCKSNKFNLKLVSEHFNTDPNVIKRRLRRCGFTSWEKYAKHHNKDYVNESWNNIGSLNPRFRHDFAFVDICNFYNPGVTRKDCERHFGVTLPAISRRLRENGFKNWTDFVKSYENDKVRSVEYYGIEDVYDITVDEYENFATDSVFSHNCPEIAVALDVVADETVGGDDRGKAFHVYSKDPKIKHTLDELYYDIINVEFNLRPWVRNLVKYGDFFLFHEVLPDFGIVNVAPIPVSEIEREEGFDQDDPYAVRFKWLTKGNQYLENWQVTHMRVLGNDLFLPYGVSMLEPARRIFRQLTMLEDAMLVYRVVRAPDRRVFYIDVSSVAPNDIPAYMEAAKATLRSTTITDSQFGRGDQRHDPLSLIEDFFIPTRGSDSGTKIDTLAGATNATATEDIEYIQKKLFAALKVPKPYLNFDENTGAKATLAQEDVRFSRTIGIYQKIILAELNKLAMIHLFAKGFDGEDLTNFELKLSNPSTVALQQRLEIWQTKTDVAAAMKEMELVDHEWIQKNILELTDEDCNKVNEGKIRDHIRAIELEAMETQERVTQQMKTVDYFDPTNYEMSGEGVEKTPVLDPDDPETSQVGLAAPETAEDILARIKSYDAEGNPYFVNYDGKSPPVKASVYAAKRHNRIRRLGATGRDATANPDFNAMVSAKSKSLTDLYDKSFLDDPLDESVSTIRFSKPRIVGEMASVIKRMKNSPKFKDFNSEKDAVTKMLTEERFDEPLDQKILTEAVNVEDDDIDLDNIGFDEAPSLDVDVFEEYASTMPKSSTAIKQKQPKML